MGKVEISITVKTIGKDIRETDCLSGMLHNFAVAFILPTGSVQHHVSIFHKASTLTPTML